MIAGLRVYGEIARLAFQRQLAYRTANLAGLITNSFFGYLRAAVFVAMYQGRASIVGYDQHAAVTYSWVTQALIMVVSLWGFWDVEETIRSGDVVSDLARPFSFLGYWLARDYGRAFYFALFRCAPIFLVGQVLFGLRWPTSPLTWLAFLVSLVLANALSFAWRYAINLSAFWTADARGLGGLLSAYVLVASGFIVPLPYFPEPFRSIFLAMPFAGIVQSPVDIFLERVTGPALLVALGQQLAWAAALLALAQGLTTVATRRVVVQGG
jgi:ABC-2 type transport system permease protein